MKQLNSDSLGPEGLGWVNTWQKSEPLPAPRAPAERAVTREMRWVPGTQTAAMGNWCCTRSLQWLILAVNKIGVCDQP